MTVEPYAARIARPIAIPIIRATVTVADAAPNDERPADSTAAVERGVTVSPKPSPKSARRPATATIPTLAFHWAISRRPTTDAARPPRDTTRSGTNRMAKPDTR